MKATFENIVNALVEIHNDREKLAQYNTTGIQYECFGTLGAMSPITRPAFAERFGVDATTRAEAKALEIVGAQRQAFGETEYHKHETEATAHADALPVKGGYIWAACAWLKCEGGTRHALNNMVWDEATRKEEGRESRPLCLVYIEDVRTVKASEFMTAAEEIARGEELPGGSRSEDQDRDDLTEEQKRGTWYTVGVAVVDDLGRWCVIDSEGYNYTRYILFPADWRKMFAPEVAEIEAENERKENERKAEEQAQKEQREADYKARCAKWAHLMQDVNPIEEEERKAWKAYQNAHYKKGSAEAKASTAAKRRTCAARKNNILAMARAGFPGVRFSVTHHSGWGEDFTLSWVDGPTEKEVNEVLDLDLFCARRDYFNGYDDSTEVIYAEFVEFSRLTMGSEGGNVKTERTMSAEKKEEILRKVFEVVPEADNRNTYGYFDRFTYTEEQAHTVAVNMGCAVTDIFAGFSYALHYDPAADEIAHRYFCRTSYYKKPTEPTPAPKKGGKAQEVATVATDGEILAEGDGVTLTATEKGAEFSGNTYAHKDEIKALGARWYRLGKCWTVKADKVAEAVEMVKGWQTEPTPTEAEETTTEATEGEKMVFWMDMELTENEALRAGNMLTLLEGGNTCVFITSEGEEYRATPTAKGCIYKRPCGTTFGESLENVAAMLAQVITGDPGRKFYTEKASTEEAQELPAPPAEIVFSPYVVSFCYDWEQETSRKDFRKVETVEYIEELARNKQSEGNAALFEYFETFQGSHGFTIRYRFKGSHCYYMLFCSELWGDGRPEYQDEAQELKAWADAIEEEEERKRWAAA